MIDFNTEPYNDDFSEDNKFYRILFRPSFAVQARELTQLQTILQNQISRAGNHLFKEGAMVIPGQISIDTNAHYIKVKPSYSTFVTETFIQNQVGKTIIGESGIKAQIIKVVSSTVADPYTVVYLRYNTSADDGVTQVFAAEEVITTEDGAYSFQTLLSDSSGIGSLATIQRGVYYVNGFFVLCADPVTGGEQTIVLDKFSNTPSYRVGLSIVESSIVPEDDETLLDNAQTSYNFAAPGAHRYHIDLVLTKKAIDSEDDENFIELLQTSAGSLKRIVTKTDYSELDKTFARRTFDESGNYDVRPFNLDVREARTNDRGAWVKDANIMIGDVMTNAGNTYVAKSAGSTAGTAGPVHSTGTAYDGPGETGIVWEYTETPVYNRGVSLTGSADQLALVMDPGKAYVQGYEIEKVAAETIYIDKTRSADHIVQVENALIPATIGNYIIVNAVHSAPLVNTFATVDLYSKISQEPAVSLTGTVTCTTSSTTVTGSSTAFTTQLVIGSVLYNSAGTVIGTVAAIASNTSLTLTANAAVAVTAAAIKKDSRGTAVSGNKIGTARVRFMEWHNGDIGTMTCQYKLGLFDIKMNSGYDFVQNVKSIYGDNSAGDVSYDFTADISPVTKTLSGYSTSTTTVVTGAGTSFQTDLVAGDYVYLGTNIRRVVSVDSQNQITVDRAVTVTGELVKRITTEIREPNYEPALFNFPYYAIKDARAADTTNKITYSVYERFTATASSASGGNCTLTVFTASGTMGSGAETDNYILVDTTTGLIVPVIPENISTSGTSATFTLPTSPVDYSTRSFIVIGAVTKTLGVNTEKSKQLVTLTATSTPNPAPTYTSQALATASTILLGYGANPNAADGTLVADGYRIISIKQATGFAWDSTPSDEDYVEDISDRYDFDDGQTSAYYGIAKLLLKPSYAPANAPFRVEFEYFDHGTGDYFTRNSYSGIDYKFIPTYAGQPLRDAIDFRPRISGDNATFDGSGGSVSLVPKRGVDIEADFSYYLARKDKIAIDFNGNFFAIKGIPSLNPGEPADPSMGMVLYTLTLEPYVFTTLAGSVGIRKQENKRYTMRDIGKLEQRINTLEYYTSLSLLEQETQSLEITDSATGLNRFKNGFVVDNFSGHSTGDTSSKDYFCSIDMENNELRPFYTMQNVNLIEKNSSDAQRTSSNYKLYGDVITLPLDATTPHVELVKQPYASRLENINPFAIFTFLGEVKINPSSDEWFEVDRRPDIVQNEEGDFNTIATLAQKAGVLGTVWNAWQTQWTGAPVSQGVRSYSADRRYGDGGAAMDARFGIGPEAPGWAARTVTTEVFAQQVGQSRTGINTRVVAKIDKRQVDDRVLSSAVIPYIRSRNILIQATGLKPNTTFYPYFDNVSVGRLVTPATKITITLASGQTGAFDTQTNVGGNAIDPARRIGGDTQVCLNRGDLITGNTSGATAIVVGSEKEFNTAGTVVTSRSIYVVNIKGTFQAGETITGSVGTSPASATVSSVGTIKVAGSPVTTNFNGEAQMLFNIPNTDSIRFRTGQRQFALTDSTTNGFDFTSRGLGNYFANGVLETKQATFISTRNAEIVREQVADNQTIVQTSERVVSDTGWYDPLAQTFLVQSTGGAFLTKVDVYFASKSITVPVTIEIREVVNGYPGKRILPFSRVTKKPEDVNISTNMVDLDGIPTPSYDTATTFEFPSPVYVQDNTEYAVVLVSDSNGYKVWISNMGDKIPNSSRTISEQPYAGVMFKSQNGSTWTANQDQDLKFTVYRAKFKTNTIGTVQFVNDINPLVTLDKDPFETNIGADKLKIYQKNHGFEVGSKVTIENSDTTKMYGVAPTSGTITCNTGSATVTGVGTVFETDIGAGTAGQGTVLYSAGGSYIGVVASVASDTSLTLVTTAAATVSSAASFKIVESVNGIPATEVYKQQTITAVIDNESYVVSTTTTAKKTGYFGGTSIFAQQNIPYVGVQPIAAVQSFSDTSSLFSMKGTGGVSINGSEPTNYPADSSWIGLIPNENNYFAGPKVIASEEIEKSASLMNNRKSVTLQCMMSTTNDALSPMLDTHRMSLIAINNTINNPSESTVNQAELDDVNLITTNTNIGFTAAANATILYSTDSTTRGLLRTIQVGKYITISGATNAANGSTVSPKTYLVTKVAENTAGTQTQVTLLATGVTEAAGASVSVVVRNHFIDEISPVGSSTASKYVTKKINLETAADTLKIRLAVNLPTKANLEVYYKTSPVGSKDNWTAINYTLASPDSPITKVELGNEKFVDVDYTLNNLTPFDSFCVKLVFKSTNAAEVPRVKDLRVIACS